MLLQFSQTSPSVEVWEGNENASDASRASKLSSNVPGDLSLACFVDPVLSVQLLGDDTIGVPPEIYDAIPQLMTEAPSKQLEQQIQAVDVTQIRLAQQLRVS